MQDLESVAGDEDKDQSVLPFEDGDSVGFFVEGAAVHCGSGIVVAADISVLENVPPLLQAYAPGMYVYVSTLMLAEQPARKRVAKSKNPQEGFSLKLNDGDIVDMDGSSLSTFQDAHAQGAPVFIWHEYLRKLDVSDCSTDATQID